MAKIRRGTLNDGSGAVANVKNVNWKDANEVDRSATDENMSGDPVEMKKAGSGSLVLTAGNIATGYAAGDVVITYNEVSVTDGSETVSQKTATFTKVYFNSGGNIDNDAGPGEIQIDFDYAMCTIADAA